MSKLLLKEYIRLIVEKTLWEQGTSATVSTGATSGTVSSSSTTGARGSTSTASTTATGTRRAGEEAASDREDEADTALSSIEDKVEANSDKIDGINKNLTASRADATRMSLRTREMQTANQNVQRNIGDASKATEDLRDAGNREEQRAAYNKTATALKNVADNVGSIATAQGNVADTLNKQGSRAIEGSSEST
jgi:septal ring factor EnvC (AmiA/AmiB activator)